MSGHIYVHEGKRYRTVERKAEVGEKILVSKVPKDWETDCKVFTVSDFDNDGDVEFDETKYLYTRNGDYVVLEPLESEECCENEPTVDTTQASEQVIEMFTALSRKIVSLESQLRDTQRNLETFAEQTESNSEDIRTIDERTKPKEDSEINHLADFILKHYGHEIGLGNPKEGESAVDVAIRLLTPVTVQKYLVNGGERR